MSSGDDDPFTPATHDFGLLRRLLGYLRPHAAAVFVSFLLIVAQAGIDLVGPYLTKIAIDRHIARGDAAGPHARGAPVPADAGRWRSRCASCRPTSCR